MINNIKRFQNCLLTQFFQHVLVNLDHLKGNFMQVQLVFLLLSTI